MAIVESLDEVENCAPGLLACFEHSPIVPTIPLTAHRAADRIFVQQAPIGVSCVLLGPHGRNDAPTQDLADAA